MTKVHKMVKTDFRKWQKFMKLLFFLSVRVKETYTSINQSTNKKETYISIEE